MIGQTTITIIKIRLTILILLEEMKMSSEIRDINLAESGERKIEWVKRNCDLLRTLEEGSCPSCELSWLVWTSLKKKLYFKVKCFLKLTCIGSCDGLYMFSLGSGTY